MQRCLAVFLTGLPEAVLATQASFTQWSGWPCESLTWACPHVTQKTADSPCIVWTFFASLTHLFLTSPHSAALVFLMFTEHCRYVPALMSLPILHSLFGVLRGRIFFSFWKVFSNGIMVRPYLTVLSKISMQVPNHL